MLSLAIFVVCYLLFIIWPQKKAWIACVGAVALLLLGALSPSQAFWEIQWNVIGLFVGTLILAELFLLSRMPAVLAEKLVDRSRTVSGALMKIFLLTSVFSMFVENVAVVLLLAPVALALCEKLKISPIKPLIFLAMFSNLQGTATLIGDPPSMILGSYMKMNFMDFFFYQGRPSIFFIVQAGALSTLLWVYWMFHHYKQPIEIIAVEAVQSWVPSILLATLIIFLVFSSWIDPHSVWLAGTAAMGLGIIGLIWNKLGPRWHASRQIIRDLDWDTTFFLIALFILVGAIREAGWMETLSNWIATHVPNSVFLVFLFIISFSLLVSAFVDNVPYLIAMIPVVQQVADVTQFPLYLLIFALLIGTCLGGNITPIGASANIVAVSILEKRGYAITFPFYMRLGIVFTLVAVIPASIVLWWIWAK